MLRSIVVLVLALVFLVLVACSGPQERLTDKTWKLTELDGKPLVADTSITANFDEDGNVGGTAGCNRYNTTYDLKGNKITVSDLVMTTLMACPEDVMAQEQLYLDTLKVAATFDTVDDELILFDTNGEVLAKFTVTNQ